MSKTYSSPFAARLAVLIYGIIAYLGFHAAFLSMIPFLNDGPLPLQNAIEGDSAISLTSAVVINLALVALFGIQHAIMARPAFKAAWTKIIPESIERSTFVVATVLVIAALIRGWQPIPGHLYQVENESLRTLIYVLQAAGWGIVVWTTFLIDHFELFGLRQVWCAFREKKLPVQQFRSPSLYRFSRHPMMVGMLIGLWAAPDMSMGRLVWALGFTVYVMLGIQIEERDLVRHLGDDYRRYQRSVSQLIPLPSFSATKRDVIRDAR